MAESGEFAYLGAIMASQEIEQLASALARLPGLGPRSARRAEFGDRHGVAADSPFY